MPNWCYTQTRFSGKKENIERLDRDIKRAHAFLERNGYRYCNLFYFLLLNGFDTESYAKSKDNGMIHKNNFRGFITNHCIDTEDEELSYLYPEFETAWWMDITVLHMIANMYDLKFSSYSEEPNTDLYQTCHNTDDKYYDLDIIIRPDYEQLEAEYEKDPKFDIGYTFACNVNDPEFIQVTKELEKRSIEYEVGDVPDVSNEPWYLHGVYYEMTPRGVCYPGVTYDED